MNRLLFILFFCLCQLPALGRGNGSDGLIMHETHVDDTVRTYWVYNPGDGATDAPLPVVFMFHGSRGNGKTFSQTIGFNKVAERENYLAVYPDALVGNWAEGCGCNLADRLGVKDPDFIRRIISEIGRHYPIDTNNIFGVGFSQGGLFADRLACEMSDIFRGMVIIAANMSKPLSQSCSPSSPLPVVFIQGTMDSVLPYDGSDAGVLSLLSAKEATEFWAEKNGIEDEPEISYRPDSLNSSVEILRYKGSEKNRFIDVTLFSLIGAGHTWPRTMHLDPNEEIVNFIRQYRAE